MQGRDSERQASLLLLAAGNSQRLGRPKQLLMYQAETLLRRAARIVLASLCHPIIVVLGAQAEKMQAELKDLPVITVFNGIWPTGMASSIRIGIEHLILQDEIGAVVVMLCDQPGVDVEAINKLVIAYRTTNAPIVAAKYNGTHGVPALFARQFYPALLALTGSQGAKSIILAHAAQLTEVSMPEAAFDIDMLADYERFVED
ncbi:MAG: nucleotidyltransferase family protein [Methylobacter sp.]|nr:nucleotidyltransferase family protein [Methylobacter sp.]